MATPICWQNCSHNSIALQIWMQLSITSYCTYGMYLLYRAKTNADLAIQSFAWKSCEWFKAWFERLQMLWSFICCNTTISQHMMSLPRQESRSKQLNNCTNISRPFAWCSKELFTWSKNYHPLHLHYYKPESFNKKCNKDLNEGMKLRSFIPALVICNIYRPRVVKR